MKKQHFLLGTGTIFMMVMMVLGPQAYANESSRFNHMIQGLHAQRAQIELQLGIDPKADTYPHATSYYDDLEDHYAQDQLMSDLIGEGICQV